jgi:hypothetical protein
VRDVQADEGDVVSALCQVGEEGAAAVEQALASRRRRGAPTSRTLVSFT